MSNHSPEPDDLTAFLDGTGPVPTELRRAVDALTGDGAPAPDPTARHSVVARMAEVLTTSHSAQGAPVIGHRSRRLAALSTVGVLLFGGVAAAAGGSDVIRDVFGADESTDTTTDGSTDTTTDGSTDTTTDGSTDTTTDESTDTTVDEACAAAENHGAYVSDVAKDKTDGETNHGQVVSEAAKSDCGKSDDEAGDDETDGTDDTDSTDATETTEDDAPGKSGTAPGRTGDTPGQSGSAASNGNGNGSGNGNRQSED